MQTFPKKISREPTVWWRGVSRGGEWGETERVRAPYNLRNYFLPHSFKKEVGGRESPKNLLKKLPHTVKKNEIVCY